MALALTGAGCLAPTDDPPQAPEPPVYSDKAWSIGGFAECGLPGWLGDKIDDALGPYGLSLSAEVIAVYDYNFEDNVHSVEVLIGVAGAASIIAGLGAPSWVQVAQSTSSGLNGGALLGISLTSEDDWSQPHFSLVMFGGVDVAVASAGRWWYVWADHEYDAADGSGYWASLTLAHVGSCHGGAIGFFTDAEWEAFGKRMVESYESFSHWWDETKAWWRSW